MGNCIGVGRKKESRKHTLDTKNPQVSDWIASSDFSTTPDCVADRCDELEADLEQIEETKDERRRPVILTHSAPPQTTTTTAVENASADGEMGDGYATADENLDSEDEAGLQVGSEQLPDGSESQYESSNDMLDTDDVIEETSVTPIPAREVPSPVTPMAGFSTPVRAVEPVSALQTTALRRLRAAAEDSLEDIPKYSNRDERPCKPLPTPLRNWTFSPSVRPEDMVDKSGRPQPRKIRRILEQRSAAGLVDHADGRT